jgi:hypothetical protein
VSNPQDSPARVRRRRANGEGSIWLRKDGRYGFAAYVPTTAGTYKGVQGYGKTHNDARRKLTELIGRADQGLPVASVNWTVADYLTHWLREVVREDRRPKTYQGYEGVVRLHLIPGLGEKRIGKLSAQDARLFITRVRRDRRPSAFQESLAAGCPAPDVARYGPHLLRCTLDVAGWRQASAAIGSRIGSRARLAGRRLKWT